jgi:hypothetical protein
MASARQKKSLSVLLGAIAVIFLSQGPSAIDRIARDLTTQADLDRLLQDATSDTNTSLLGGLSPQADLDRLAQGATSGNNTLGDEATAPLIYTFFNQIGNDKDPMVDTWKREWEKIGFKTKVLTLEDAVKHPYFETMKKAVEKVFGGDEYNRLCFYRYLAMANVGGIMSDYDTFPTNFPLEQALELPNGGAFTSFQAHVPSLISASAEEWERVAILITEQIQKTKMGIKSDMMMLKELGDEGGYNLIFMVPAYNVQTFLPYKDKGVVNCREAAHYRAVHVSHYAVGALKKSGFYPTGEVKELDQKARRPKVAEIFLREWEEQCGGNSYLKGKAMIVNNDRIN